MRGPSGSGIGVPTSPDQRLDLRRREGHEHDRVANLDLVPIRQWFADDDLVGRARGGVTPGDDPRPGDIAKHDVVGGSPRREERAVRQLNRRRVHQRRRLHPWKRPQI